MKTLILTLLLTLLLTVCLWSQKSPVDYFKQYDLNVLLDTSAKFVVLTNSSNISENILQDVAYVLTIYSKYTNIFPQTKLNGVLWWFDNKNVVFDRFWMSNYITSSRSGQMNLIYLKLALELDTIIPRDVLQSRAYQSQENQRYIESTRSMRGR